MTFFDKVHAMAEGRPGALVTESGRGWAAIGRLNSGDIHHGDRWRDGDGVLR